MASYDFVSTHNRLDSATDFLIPCKFTSHDASTTSYFSTDTFSTSSRCCNFPNIYTTPCGSHWTIIFHLMATCSCSNLPIHLNLQLRLQRHDPQHTLDSAHPRHTAVKAAPKVRIEKKPEKPRRPAQAPPPTPTASAPPASPASPNVQQDLANLGTTAKELAESVRLLQAHQQQPILDSQRLQEPQQQQQQQQLRQNFPPTITPSPPATIPTPPPTTPAPAAKARPIEPPAPGHTASSTTPALPIRVPSTSPLPSGTPTSRHRRSRSPRHPRPHRDPPQRHPQRPRSPLPRHRSTTKHPKGRRTPSPYRRRSPPRRPEPPRRHRTPDPPRRSRTPSRSAIVLTPAPRSLDPGFITTPDADDTWGNWQNHHPPDAHHSDARRPRSPQTPPSNTSATAPLGSVTYRVATGESDASDPEESFSIAYDPCDTEIEEMNAAAEDPFRTRCVTELGSSNVVSLRTELDNPTKILYNNFIDEMFNQLAKPYTTSSNETIYIKASRATVTNIARAFAQARLLSSSNQRVC